MAEGTEAEEGAGASRATGCIVKLVSHGAALLAGVVVGFVVPVLYEQIQNPEIMASPEADFSRAELIAKLDAQEKAYQELLERSTKLDSDQKQQLTAASTKVVDLEGAVAARLQEIEVIKTKLKKSEGKSAARKKELEAKEAELASLQAQLAVAIQEKEKLTQDLEISRQETTVARQETEVARGETFSARVDEEWAKFRANTILKVCKKGTVNRLDRCRTEVDSAVSKLDRRFKGCMLSRQATPRLVEVTDKRDLTLPTWSEWLAQDSDFAKDKYYVIFCDPSLPEAPEGDLSDEPL